MGDNQKKKGKATNYADCLHPVELGRLFHAAKLRYENGVYKGTHYIDEILIVA